MNVQFYMPRTFQVQQISVEEEQGLVTIRPFAGEDRSYALIGHVVADDGHNQKKAYDLKVQRGTGHVKLVALSASSKSRSSKP